MNQEEQGMNETNMSKYEKLIEHNNYCLYTSQ